MLAEAGRDVIFVEAEVSSWLSTDGIEGSGLRDANVELSTATTLHTPPKIRKTECPTWLVMPDWPIELGVDR